MTFNSIEEVKRYILDKSKNAIETTKEQVYQIINRSVKEFYVEYSPEMYERTYQLYRSLVKSDVRSTGNGWEAYVYFDYSSLVYSTNSGEPLSGYDVVSTAAHGGHGVDRLHSIQVGGGIWNEPMSILNSQMNSILRRNLISAGIPLS